MASIPNLNSLRSARGGPRRRRGGRPDQDDSSGASADTETPLEAARDRVVRTTDHDASSSRMSAIALGYLSDGFAGEFFEAGQQIPKRYPIINRGTYVRTEAIDKLVRRFLRTAPERTKQIVSLGAGSDTRFFRLAQESSRDITAEVIYHELDFEANMNQKRNAIRNSPRLSNLIESTRRHGWRYRLHAIDLRDLTKQSPPSIPDLDPDSPTLLLSECCLCYLPPESVSSVIQYFTMHVQAPLALVLYEPIRPFDPFGKIMVSNLASRGIHLQTLKQYSTLEAQRQRLRLAGFTDGQGARDVLELWGTNAWIGEAERERVNGLEWLDEVEEWHLLASHYCVAWGWKGDVFRDAWSDLNGSRSPSEANDAMMD